MLVNVHHHLILPHAINKTHSTDRQTKLYFKNSAERTVETESKTVDKESESYADLITGFTATLSEMLI